MIGKIERVPLTVPQFDNVEKKMLTFWDKETL